jgi:hypothetical protein
MRRDGLGKLCSVEKNNFMNHTTRELYYSTFFAHRTYCSEYDLLSRTYKVTFGFTVDIEGSQVSTTLRTVVVKDPPKVILVGNSQNCSRRTWSHFGPYYDVILRARYVQVLIVLSTTYKVTFGFTVYIEGSQVSTTLRNKVLVKGPPKVILVQNSQNCSRRTWSHFGPY